MNNFLNTNLYEVHKQFFFSRSHFKYLLGHSEVIIMPKGYLVKAVQRPLIYLRCSDAWLSDGLA